MPKRELTPKTAGSPAESFAGYDDLLCDIKERVQSARVRAALAVNRELVLLYWSIGQDISERIKQHGWGAKAVDRLSGYLRREFPDHLPRPGWTSQLSSRLLDKFPGSTIASCWTK